MGSGRKTDENRRGEEGFRMVANHDQDENLEKGKK